jgi:hypothetical protein
VAAVRFPGREDAAAAPSRLRVAPWAVVLGLLVAAAFSPFALAWLPAPWGWIGVAWAAACLLGAVSASPSGLRLAALYLCVVLLVPAAFELRLGLRTKPRLDPALPEENRLRDDVVGFRLAPGTASREASWFGDELVYDVVYTIDDNGLRLAPPAAGGEGSLCVLFFGGSFTFGTGVEDRETAAYQLGVLTGGRHRIYNFGFSGYGPHQMLATLESGRVERAIGCTPSHVIYHSVHDHVRRVAGRAPWDPHGPRYELTPGGGVVRRGNFDDAGAKFPEGWPRLGRSEILRMLAQDFDPQPRDYQRFAAVVDASRAWFAEHYPGARFHVLLWNKAWKQDPEYWEGLLRRGIRVHFITDVLPDYPEARERYAVSPHDGHPNALAHARIAEYVAREILGRDGEAPGG